MALYTYSGEEAVRSAGSYPIRGIRHQPSPRPGRARTRRCTHRSGGRALVTQAGGRECLDNGAGTRGRKEGLRKCKEGGGGGERISTAFGSTGMLSHVDHTRRVTMKIVKKIHKSAHLSRCIRILSIFLCVRCRWVRCTLDSPPPPPFVVFCRNAPT